MATSCRVTAQYYQAEMSHYVSIIVMTTAISVRGKLVRCSKTLQILTCHHSTEWELLGSQAQTKKQQWKGKRDAQDEAG